MSDCNWVMILVFITGLACGIGGTLLIGAAIVSNIERSASNFIISLNEFYKDPRPVNHRILRYYKNMLPEGISEKIKGLVLELKLFPEEKQESEGEKLEEEEEKKEEE